MVQMTCKITGLPCKITCRITSSLIGPMEYSSPIGPMDADVAPFYWAREDILLTWHFFIG